MFKNMQNMQNMHNMQFMFKNMPYEVYKPDVSMTT